MNCKEKSSFQNAVFNEENYNCEICHFEIAFFCFVLSFFSARKKNRRKESKMDEFSTLSNGVTRRPSEHPLGSVRVASARKLLSAVMGDVPG
jgi:hypothetical protein